MDSSIPSAASRDNHLVLRWVERHQHVVELLHGISERLTLRKLSSSD